MYNIILSKELAACDVHDIGVWVFIDEMTDDGFSVAGSGYRWVGSGVESASDALPNEVLKEGL